MLIGPNGGGKSALFDAILNFSMLATGNIRQAFGGYPYSYSATKYRAATSIARIGFDVIMSRAKDDPQKLSYMINYAQQGVAEPGNSTFANFYGIGRFNRFRLSPHELSRPSRIPEITGDSLSAPRLGYEGEDLAACLYCMQETKDPALTKIIEEVNAVLPSFDGFEFNILGVERVAFSMKFTDGRGTINSARMSHGNLLFLGLMVLTYSSNRPPVMLMEEPENGLTPAAIEHFYSAVRALAFREDASQRSQVLISSHSPFVMCEAWNGEDRDFIHQVKIENGQSVIRKLSEVIALNAGPLGKDKSGERSVLSLRNAAELMSGYLQ